MKTIFALGLGTVVLAGCGGNVSLMGAGGAGGHGGATTTGTSSSGSTSSSSTGSTTSSSTSSSTTTSTGSTTSSSTSSSTSASSTTSSSGGGCTAANCGMPGFGCCNNTCVNLKNDILNCGTCNTKCGGTHPYCDMGTCGTPPCGGIACPSSEFCCGTECCAAGQICCTVPGPVTTGPKCQAPDPVTMTCDKGCTGCVCASPDTPIATPLGSRPISELAAGDLVYSVDHEAIVAVPVLRTHRAPVHDHHVVRVTLESGAVLEISPRHPTADGRTFADLRKGDTLDRFGVTGAELVPYQHPFTYDILPASDTHTYFAGGALVGTTMPF